MELMTGIKGVLMLDWAREHYFLTFVLLWCTLEITAKIISRTYRMIMVLVHGWPPDHLDADGDWKPNAQAQDR